MVGDKYNLFLPGYYSKKNKTNAQTTHGRFVFLEETMDG